MAKPVFHADVNSAFLPWEMHEATQAEFRQQLTELDNADNLYLDRAATRKIENFERDHMYVIDTNALYRYDSTTDMLTELIRLDDVHCIDNVRCLL